jgi:hypothetical protein
MAGFLDLRSRVKLYLEKMRSRSAISDKPLLKRFRRGRPDRGRRPSR